MHFASKAFPCAPVLRVLAEEGLGCDVASAGELAIALAAGFDPADILLHGNAKSDEDIARRAGRRRRHDRDRRARRRRPPGAPRAGAARRVLRAHQPGGAGRHARGDGHRQPGGEVRRRRSTRAPALLDRIAAVAGLELRGLHVHIGSQLLDLDGFGRAAQAIAALGRFPVYDLGGGLGIAYTPDERAPSIADYADATVAALHRAPRPGGGADRRARPLGRRPLRRDALLGRHRQAPGAHARGGQRRHGRQPRADDLRPALRARDPRPRAAAGDVRAGRPPLRERRHPRARRRARDPGGRRPAS